jgi:hypothetical protein
MTVDIALARLRTLVGVDVEAWNVVGQSSGVPYAIYLASRSPPLRRSMSVTAALHFQGVQGGACLLLSAWFPPFICQTVFFFLFFCLLLLFLFAYADAIHIRPSLLPNQATP